VLGVFDIAKFARLDELVMHSSVKEEQERLLLALQLELFALSAPQSSHVRYRMSPSVIRYNLTFPVHSQSVPLRCRTYLSHLALEVGG
jgi:hypothetical protein